MKAIAHWSLLYRRALGEEPSQFCEIRRAGRSIWSASGWVKTWGAQSLVDYEDEEAARTAHAQLMAEKEATGFKLARAGVYDPTTFAYSLLQNEVEQAVEKGFRAICDANPDSAIDSFALATDHDAMTIVWAANAAGREADDDARFDVYSWRYDDFSDWTDIAYRMMLSKLRDIPFEWVDGMPPEARRPLHHGSDEGWSHRDGVYEALIRALESLRRKGVFSMTLDGREFLLLMMIKDHWQVDGMAERLNSAGLARRFAGWLGADSAMEIRPPPW